MSGNFKPGDKVWLHITLDWRTVSQELVPSRLDIGRHAAVLLRGNSHGFWELDVEGYSAPEGADGTFAHESILSPRDDPPPEQVPKREEVGDWDVCPWRPEVVVSS